MANQFLGLSMFIMLLSFFIVLNAVSNFQDMKSMPVLQSLAQAFSSKEIGEQEAPTYEETVQESFKQGQALDNINGLFSAQITGVEATQNRLGTEMHIRLKLDAFEKNVMNAIATPEGEQVPGTKGDFFLPTLVSLLNTGDTGLPYRMDMVLAVSASPSQMQNKSPQNLEDFARRAGILAQQLERAGLPKKLFSTGLGQGKKGYVDLYFRRYEPFNPFGKNALPKNDAAAEGAEDTGSAGEENVNEPVDNVVDDEVLP